MLRARTQDPTKRLPNVPDRFGEANWRRFEKIILHYVETYPLPVVFRPKTIALTTALCRIRDAVRAFLHPQNNWESPVNADKLREIWAKSYVSIVEDDRIEIRSTKNLQIAELQLKDEFRDALFVDAEENPELFCAVMCCKNNNFFPQQVTVVKCPDDLRAAQAGKYPNVVFLETDDPTVFNII